MAATTTPAPAAAASAASSSAAAAARRRRPARRWRWRRCRRWRRKRRDAAVLNLEAALLGHTLVEAAAAADAAGSAAGGARRAARVRPAALPAGGPLGPATDVGTNNSPVNGLSFQQCMNYYWSRAGFPFGYLSALVFSIGCVDRLAFGDWARRLRRHRRLRQRDRQDLRIGAARGMRATFAAPEEFDVEGRGGVSPSPSRRRAPRSATACSTRGCTSSGMGDLSDSTRIACHSAAARARRCRRGVGRHRWDQTKLHHPSRVARLLRLVRRVAVDAAASAVVAGKWTTAIPAPVDRHLVLLARERRARHPDGAGAA